MSSPIPISTPPNSNSSDKLPTSTSPSTSSTASISPRTPFLAPPAGTTQLGVSPTGSNIVRWASGLSSLAKSPPTSTMPTIPAGAPIPSIPTAQFENDEHEHHDSFEFGDFAHSKDKSWTGHSRRAASMSLPSGHTAASAGSATGGGGGGITSMLTGFGSTAPPLSPPLGEGGQLGATVGSPLGSSFANGMAGSVPQGGVLADKAAKAQGVMRRLSIGGGGYRPSFLSPTSAAQPLASPPKNIPALPKAAAPAPAPQQPLPVPAGADNLAPPSFARGRRFSETGVKKRSVSPMGERMLREHGHF